MPADQNKIPGAQATDRMTALYARMSAAVQNELVRLRDKGEVSARDKRRLRGMLAKVLGVTEKQALKIMEDGVAASIKAGAGQNMVFGADKRTAEARAAAKRNLETSLKSLQQAKVEKGMSYMKQANEVIGRRVDDIARQIGVEQVAQTLDQNRTGGQTARAIADEIRNAPAQGPLKDIDGKRFFQDRIGRNWVPENYARMVTRTTTREAMSEAFIARAKSDGQDLVRVSTHQGGNDDPHCGPYDDKLFSLSGTTPGVPVLDEPPPWHPNCKHVLIPPTLDDIESTGGGA